MLLSQILFITNLVTKITGWCRHIFCAIKMSRPKRKPFLLRMRRRETGDAGERDDGAAAAESRGQVWDLHDGHQSAGRAGLPQVTAGRGQAQAEGGQDGGGQTWPGRWWWPPTVPALRIRIPNMLDRIQAWPVLWIRIKFNVFGSTTLGLTQLFLTDCLHKIIMFLQVTTPTGDLRPC